MRLFVVTYLCFVMGAVANAADETQSTTSVETPERTLAEIHKEVRLREKEMPLAKTDVGKAKNIGDLCGLFIEIGQHSELPKSATLQSLSVRLRSRLLRIEDRTAAELRRRKIPEPQAMVADRKAYQKSRDRASKQVAAGRAANTARSSNSRGGSTGELNSQGGGTTSSGNAAAANSAPANSAPGGMPDYGWSLVDLIRKTVRPDYWAVSGGPGKALYFGHSRALVIHGSWTVQEDVADLLTALRGG